MILDEPTAVLDPTSEYEIFSQFEGMLAGKIGVFISHWMGSCKFCSKIFVLDQGRIIQKGNHEQLMQQLEGLYAGCIWNRPVIAIKLHPNRFHSADEIDSNFNRRESFR